MAMSFIKHISLLSQKIQKKVYKEKIKINIFKEEEKLHTHTHTVRITWF